MSEELISILLLVVIESGSALLKGVSVWEREVGASVWEREVGVRGCMTSLEDMRQLLICHGGWVEVENQDRSVREAGGVRDQRVWCAVEECMHL